MNTKQYERQDPSELPEYEAFLIENHRKINRTFNQVLRACIFAGPMIAVAISLHVFSGVTYGMALFVSVFMLVTTVVHSVLLRRHSESPMIAIVALVSVDVLLIFMNRAHLTIYISWFLVPLLSLLFCDYTLYMLTLLINFGFMVFATWDTASWYAERRIDFDSAEAYFASRISGFAIEMTMMIVAGYLLCRMISRYYRTMIEKEKELSENNDVLKRLNVELSSMTNIYASAHDINVQNDTYFEIFLKNETVRELLGEEKIHAKRTLLTVMDKMTSPRSRKDVIKFIDFDTLNERLKDVETITMEFEALSGRWHRCRYVVSERDAHGDLVRVIWLVESIDAEKKQRDELIDISQRAIAASEAKSSFLSNMSHEIRTPINTVLGMNEMIMRESGDPDILTYSNTIKAAGGTLLGLVNDILDFSKIEAGKMEIVPVDYDLSSVVKDLVSMIHTRASAKGLVLTLDINGDIPSLLNGDEIRIKQVISNILTNAVKYTDKGNVVFGIDYEKTDDDPDCIMLKVYVKDTGIGIKKENINRLFSEFERIEEDKNRYIEGTGLGMSITQKLLHMMGSSLQVESVYGLGSKFFFAVRQRVVRWQPMGDYETSFKEALKVRTKYHEKFVAPSANALVVDDNDMNLMVFASLLKKTRMNIDTALSGDEAISYTWKKKYDIIFLDHMMPKKDGIETLREIRNGQDNPNSDTIAVCLTANAISGARDEYMDAGFDDYMSKPIDPQKLEEMMIRYLPGEKTVLTEEPDEEEDVSLPEFLNDIEELNLEIGAANNGNNAAYTETLKAFSRNVKIYSGEIADYYRVGDIKNATIKVHALKSAARIIGASDLGELAQKLEDACKAENRDLLDRELHDFLERAGILGERLSPLLKEEEKADAVKKDIDVDELQRIYTQIKEHAQDCDNAGIEDALKKLGEHRIPDSEKDRVNAITKAIGMYDFDEILRLVD